MIGGFTSSTGGSNNDQFVILDPNFGEYNFKWKDQSNANVGSSNPFLCNVGPGDYTITVTNSRTGCVSDTETFTVPDGTRAIDAEIIIDQQPEVCDGTVATPNGQLTATINNPDGGSYIFTWYAGADTTGTKLQTDSVFTIDPSMPAKSSTIDSLAEGVYTVLVLDFLDPSKHCFSIVQTTLVNQKPALVVSGTSNPVTNCTTLDNGSYEVTSITEDGVPADTANYDFDLFDNTGTFVKTSTSATITGLSESSYSIVPINTLTGCEFPAKNFGIGNAHQDPTATLTKTDNVSCSTTPSGAIEVTATSPDATIANHTYEWYFGAIGNTSDQLIDGSLTNSSDVTIAPTTPWKIDGLNAGDYWVRVTDNDGANIGCSADFAAKVENKPANIVLSNAGLTVNPSTNCTPENGSVTINSFTANGVAVTGVTRADYTYALYPTAVATVPTYNSASANWNATTFTFSDLEVSSFYLEAKNNVNCASNRQLVEINPSTTNPTISFTPASQTRPTTCDGAASPNGQLVLNLTNPAEYEILWYAGSVTPANEISIANGTADAAANGLPTFSANRATLSEVPAGTYVAVVTDKTTTNLGCFSTATYDLTPNTPTLTIAAANVTKVNANNCSALDNGSLTVNSVGGDIVACYLQLLFLQQYQS